MHRWRLFFLPFLLVFVSLLSAPALAAPAQLGAKDREHAKNAFYFAERENWFEAMQHARRASNPVLYSYITWRALRDNDSALPFSTYHEFLQRNPGWPYENRLILQAEDLLFTGEATPDMATLDRWFKLHPPISGKGKLVQAELRAKQGVSTASLAPLIREAWIHGDFDASQEKNIMRRYASVLRREDHIERADRLVWEGKYTPAGRMMFALPADWQALIKARIELALGKPGVNGAIARVPAGLRNHPGLIYERMKWRERKGLDDGVEELLLAAPATVPYAEKWWRTRHIRVREALEKGRPSHALKLLANHGQVDGVGQADALWLQGWINLVYLEQAAKAFDYFLELERAVSYPVSKSRAQYWLGRAATALNRPAVAQQWYAAAAAHNTTFYGQLGAVEAQGNARLHLPRTGEPSAAQQQQFTADPRVRAVYMLAETGREEDAGPFIRQLMDEATTQSKALLTAQLGPEIGRPDMGVQASKDALKNHIVLPQTSYPYYRISFRPAIEEPLMWAITRQESLFNPTAGSSAGAKGMMQLLPSTAREVARKNGIAYQPSHLDNPQYNMRLGSAYLGEMISNFDGSYILAIAAYNAGPGRVRQWLAEYGHPGITPEAAIDWIERIPYSETRNYVQRVLENLQVYRAIVNPATGEQIHLKRDLIR